jgi:hypothetical protein
MVAVSAVVLMFIAGLAVVGTVQQTTWLINTSEPFTQSRLSTPQGEAKHNLWVMSLAVATHHDDVRQLPAGALFDDKGDALHGWQTQLLPWLEMTGLFNQIDLKLPWDHAANAPHFKQEIAVYQYPGVTPTANEKGYALSHFASNVRVIGGNVSLNLKNIKNTSQTLLIGQVGDNYKPWGYPLNWRDPALGLNQSPHGFGSHDRSGALFATVGGHVKYMTNKVSPAVLKALGDPTNGEEVVEDD